MPETSDVSVPNQNMLFLHSATELALKPEVRWKRRNYSMDCSIGYSLDYEVSRLFNICPTQQTIQWLSFSIGNRLFKSLRAPLSHLHPFSPFSPTLSLTKLIQSFVNKAYCKGWGTIYVTDDLFDAGNPWDDPPTFWSALVEAAKTIPTVQSCGTGGLKVLVPLLGSNPAGEASRLQCFSVPGSAWVRWRVFSGIIWYFGVFFFCTALAPSALYTPLGDNLLGMRA